MSRVGTKESSALLNEIAMNLFSDFEQWHHDNCTTPNHKMECVTFKLKGRKQFGMKPNVPCSILDCNPCQKESCEYILGDLFEEYMEKLSVSYENNDVESYWYWWCRIAEQWLIRHCAYATADESFLSEASYLGRGLFHLEQKQVNKTKKMLPRTEILWTRA